MSYRFAQSDRAARSSSSEPNLPPAASPLFRMRLVDSTAASSRGFPGLETDPSIPRAVRGASIESESESESESTPIPFTLPHAATAAPFRFLASNSSGLR